MTSSRFIALPIELALKALGYADFKELLALQLTCRRLRDLIADSADLQYTIELAAFGMRDGAVGEPPFTARERLERLKAYMAAWSDFSLTEFMRYGAITPSRVCGNILVSKSTLIGSHITKIHVYQMPSPLRNIDFRRWDLSFEFEFRSFYVDSTQDLLLLTSPTVPLNSSMTDIARTFSLSTGKPHPSCISWLGERHTEGFYRELEICGDYVVASVAVFMVGSFREHIYLTIWNWKTGIEEATSTLPLSPRLPGLFPDLKFLDERHIIVLANHQTRCTDGLRPHLQVYSFRRPPTSNGEVGDLTLRCKFLLPGIPANAMEARFLPSNASCWSSGSREPGIFHPDRDRLLGLRLMINGAEQYWFYVHARSLLDLLPSNREVPSEILWDTWGPRYVHTRGDADMYQGIYGMNVVGKASTAFSTQLVISDFHPRRVARTRGYRERLVREFDPYGKIGPQRAVREVRLPDGFPRNVVGLRLFDESILVHVQITEQGPARIEARILTFSASPTTA